MSGPIEYGNGGSGNGTQSPRDSSGPIIGDGEASTTETTYVSTFHSFQEDQYRSDVTPQKSFRRQKSDMEQIQTIAPKKPMTDEPDDAGGGVGHSGIPVSTGTGSRFSRQGSLRSHRGGDDHFRQSTCDIGPRSRYERGDASSIASSMSDVSSIASNVSSFSTRETTASRLRQELARGKKATENGGNYVTPSQRKEKELKSMRHEFNAVLRTLEEREHELDRLKDEKRMEEEEKRPEEERKRQRMEDLEFRVNELEEQIASANEEWKRSVQECANLKRDMADKEEQFEACYTEMYTKGLEAARFEREDEWQMHKDKKGRPTLTVPELTRKLIRTESELAKWQALRLDESYHQAPGSGISRAPHDSASASLAFVKDAFFHFVIDPSPTNTNLHLTALSGIFQYSDDQVGRMKRATEERLKADKTKK